MPPEDPVKSLADTISANWQNSNTSISTDPNVNTGWVHDDEELAEVNVTNPDEEPLRGGTTGASAADGAGGGPVQELSGTIGVHCWCDRDWHDPNPKKIAFELTEEVRRIVGANAHSITDLRFALPGARRMVPPEDEADVEIHYLQEVRYVREDRF